MENASRGLLRALCLFAAWDYPPTRPEWIAGYDRGAHISYRASAERPLIGVAGAARELIEQGVVLERRGRVTFAGQETLIEEHERREALFARKIRRARRVAQWLAALVGVRYVALCNTTSRAHADEDGDLDFIVITQRGTLWQTRGCGTLPFRLMGLRPRTDRPVRDAVCLSFFLDETVLDLSALMLSDDDPDFRHWFLNFLPLYDDGVGSEFWNANRAITDQHPFALSWTINPDFRVRTPWLRLPMPKWLEAFARHLQMHALHSEIRLRMNQDTTVVINDHLLKFHVHDGRAAFRERYRLLCGQYGVDV